MKTISEKLKISGPLVSDGAWGTFLHQKGLGPGQCPELWNIDHSYDVLDIAVSYVKAGADMILTNSFGGNKFKLQHYGLEAEIYRLNRRASEISRRAAGNEIHVLGSVGPTGVILMMGENSPEELYDTFSEQAKALADGGADAILVETMSDLEEARLAIRAAKEHTNKEVICTLTFTRTPQEEYRTMMGISPQDSVRVLIDEGADIIGANCGNGTAGMIDVVKLIRRIDRKIPVLIHANAGMPQYINGKTIFPESPGEMASRIPELIDAGANIVGGCCGTTPEHIRQIAEIVKSYRGAPRDE
jgi:5-methyltetrahydrofolate--homocysteine methyltransferase